MNAIALEITKGLKEGKWISVEYQNTTLGKNTFFWIAIKDIIPRRRMLVVDMFNFEKGSQTIEGNIYFDQIVFAQTIEGTVYERNEALLETIRSNFAEYSFLEFTGVNERVLHYYVDCYHNDRDVAVKQYTLVSGIDDENMLMDHFSLSDESFGQIVKDLHKYLKLRSKAGKQQVLRLAMNVLSVHMREGLFPLVYRGVNLDVKNKRMVLESSYSFNTKVNNKGVDTSMNRYLDCNAATFIEGFAQYREYYIQEIMSNLRKGDQIDERPYLFELQKNIGVNLELEYRMLQNQYQDGKLTASCQAFFGIYEKEKKRKKIRPIMVHNKAVNIDQYRVIQNAMNKDIVYVQGPPGTGKTATIVNTILSSLLNRFSTLVVSNNNEAINNIHRKLLNLRYHGQPIRLPVLRLGSNEYIRLALEEMHQNQAFFAMLEMNSDSVAFTKQLEDIIIAHFSQVNELIDQYDTISEVDEQIESLQDIIQKMKTSIESDEISRNLAIAGIEAQIQNIRLRTGTSVHPYTPLEVDEQMIEEYLFYLSYTYHKKLYHKKNKELKDIVLMENQDERAKAFGVLLKTAAGMTQLVDCFPIIISTNISVTKFHSDSHFELLIMDEASQCNNAIALLPMMRCRRALFVGDQNQLQPVVVLNTIKNEELIRVYDIPVAYDYKNNSMLSTLLSVDTISKFILLRDHYRCHEKIISFSNQKYYGDELKIQTRLDNLDALKLIDVYSNANEKNVSKEEIDAVIQEVRKITQDEVAVITPFRAQANRLSQELEQQGYGDVKVGTIHTFQGDEKDVIILSAGISQTSHQRSFDWIKDNQELINVATTRAKKKLIVCCDTNKVKELTANESNDFMELLEYVRRNGEYEVNYKENKLFQSKVKAFKYYNSVAEEEFLKTLLHFKSVYHSFDVQTKVKVTDVLHLGGDNKKLFQYGNQAHFDFVLYDLNRRPLLVVEVIGSEHLSDYKVIERDKKKQEICNNEGIRLITIRNDYVRRYQFIKDSILEALR